MKRTMNRLWWMLLLPGLLAGCGEPAAVETVPETAPAETEPAPLGWQEENGKSYYLLSDGTRVTGWLWQPEGTYYMDEAGYPTTGTVTVNGQRYIFGDDGLARSGWVSVDGKTCWADENGKVCTGWLELDGERYYLGGEGVLQTGWQEIDGLTYYFNEDGTAVRGILEIDGKNRFFAADGREVLLVNPWNLMPEDYTVELTDIGGGHQVAVYACEDFQEMMADCKAAGFSPKVRSSYRTMEHQKYLYARRIQRFEDQGYSHRKAVEKAGTIVAVPGTSEHQLGLALDIVDTENQLLDESQATTGTQQWLMENSWRYGWLLRYPENSSESTGIIYEPWHYRYLGRELAEEIHNSGLCMEDYFKSITPES